MARFEFKIRGLDCAEEVAILKRELSPLVGGEANLGFDLLNGKLLIEAPEAALDVERIRVCVSKTGMEAIPWEEYRARADSGEPLWLRHGRAVLCVASGLTLCTASLLHGLQHGWTDVFGGHGEHHSYPALVVALYIVALLSGIWYILPKALYSARNMRPDMNLLMTVAVCGAVILGEWMEAASVAFLFALALLLESWSVGRARKAIGSLVDLSAKTARYRCPNDGDIEIRPVEDIPLGATVLVRPGEKIPLDGTISRGATSVNQAPITGESAPIAKTLGDDVYAGSLNNEGAIEFCVTHTADDTTLARIVRMVEEAQTRRAPSEKWVEQFARYYTPAMMFLALGVAVIPPLLAGGGWTAWFYQALVILVIACPCALVISTPVSIVAGLTSAAKRGILIKGGAYLEAPAGIKAIAFDKTGTLTYGRPEVQRIVPINGHTKAELLERAAALESHSDHPLAKAVLLKAREDGVSFGDVDDFVAIAGKGAEGNYNGKAFWIGSHRLLHEKGKETPYCHEQAEALEDAGHSVLAVGNEDHVCGLISVADSIRSDSCSTVRALHDVGIKCVFMLTGDNEGTAKAVAEATGMDEFLAELLPEEKADAIKSFAARFGKVAMVGDGINDAPAMATSSLAIAMGAAGSDTAIETADIALMSDDLSKLPWLIGHSRRTLRIIKQNIFFALGLKLAFIVLALYGVATLWMAIAADMGASLLVIFNGLRLLNTES